MLLIQGLWVECKVCLSHEVGLRWQNIFLEIVQSTSKRQITCKIFFLYQTRTFLHKGILLITFNLLGLPDTQNTTWRCFSLMNWYKKITLPFNKLSVICYIHFFLFLAIIILQHKTALHLQKTNNSAGLLLQSAHFSQNISVYHAVFKGKLYYPGLFTSQPCMNTSQDIFFTSQYSVRKMVGSTGY